MKALQYFVCFFLLFFATGALAQNGNEQPVRSATNDSIAANKDSKPAKKDSLAGKHNPRKATLRSALIPGWGQAYNKQYWKIPIVYAAIGVPTGFLIYNQTWYKRTKRAFEIRITNDSASFSSIDPKLQGLSTESLRFYRNEFRRSKDYSILFLLLAWGLNVADATVSAHLKDFDVSDDLSFKIKPGFSEMANTTGISLVLAVKNPRRHKLDFSR